MKTAKKAAFGAFAATVLAMVTPLTSASADQGDTLRGGCGFVTNENTTTNGANQGKIYVRAVSQEASGLPSGAIVSCWIDVNGVEQTGTRITVDDADGPNGEGDETGIIVGQADISFVSVTGDKITECQQVTFEDGSTWTAADGNVGTDCPAATEISDQPVIDALNGILSLVDPTICPVLGSLAGSYAGGLLVIDATGDTWINDPLGFIGKVYDCPPYDPPTV